MADDTNNNIYDYSGNEPLQGLGGDDNIMGVAGDDNLTGNTGNDTLNGGEGIDFLDGGAGADLYVVDQIPRNALVRNRIDGGLYYRNPNGDEVIFESGVDKITLMKNAVLFTNLPLGVLPTDLLRIGDNVTTAADADDFFIYDTAAGILYYDADATGPAEPADIIRMMEGKQLTAADIQVVSPNSIVGTTENDTLTGTAGDDSMGGNSGNDTLFGGAGNDGIGGGPGRDVAVYAGIKADYRVIRTGTSAVVVDNNTLETNEGIDRVSLLERLHFNDISVALDLDEIVGPIDWIGNAGKVAKIIGALFGKALVNDTNLVGLGLYHMDRVNDYATLMQMALNKQLGVGASDRQVVDLLYTNVAGSAPSEAAAKFYLDKLSSGEFTHVSLAILAADSSFNAVNIDLIGLRQTGLLYHEYAV